MEFALVAPVVVLLLTGIIDFGWYFFTQQLTTSQTLDATRTAAMADWDDDPAGTLESSLPDPEG